MTPERHSATLHMPLVSRQFFGVNKLSDSRVLTGSMVMLVGSGVVSAVNFGYNVVMARYLGPSDFGQVSAIATLLMMASALTISFQLVCAKFVARNPSFRAKARVFSGLMKQAWATSIVVAFALFIFRQPMARLLRLPSPALIEILAVAVAFSVPMGVKRGGLQGLCQFRGLTTNFVLESAVKFLAALIVIFLGYGMLGAVGAIAASVVAAYLFLPVSFSGKEESKSDVCIPASFREGMQATVFSVGQVVINNVDILLVKFFFDPQRAGLYAAVALVGRLLYFAAWQVVSAMFPISAAAEEGGKKEKQEHVLLTPFLLVLTMSVAFGLVLTFAPKFIIGVVFGQQFLQAESLFGLYAVATGLYALSVVLMTYEMSRRIANTGWLQLVFSGVMVLLISLFHETLRQVIVVQIILMSILLVVVALPFLRKRARQQAPMLEAA